MFSFDMLSGADSPPSQGGRAHPREKKILCKFSKKIPSAPLGFFRPHPLEFFGRTP
ncbi:hypothetical protein Hanom_Chr09g00761261 [Helianthus anomalus]